MTMRIFDRINHDRGSTTRVTAERTSLGILCAALGLSATLACGSDDDNADATGTEVFAAEAGGPTSNGLSMPAVQDWNVVGVAARSDQGELHVARSGRKVDQ